MMKCQCLSTWPPAERAQLNRHLKDAVEACLVRPSHGEFGSLFLFVRKTDCSLRLCIDNRGLNEAIRKNAYPLPRVCDTLDDAKRRTACEKDANFYTHLDLASGF
jgi:hypothetical protein